MLGEDGRGDSTSVEVRDIRGDSTAAGARDNHGVAVLWSRASGDSTGDGVRDSQGIVAVGSCASRQGIEVEKARGKTKPKQKDKLISKDQTEQENVLHMPCLSCLYTTGAHGSDLVGWHTSFLEAKVCILQGKPSISKPK